jgi:hypothetical protein
MRNVSILVVIVLVLAAVACVLAVYVLLAPAPPVASAVVLSDGTRLSASLPSGRLIAGSSATATIIIENLGGAAVAEPHLSASVDRAPEDSLAYATWTPPQPDVPYSGPRSGVCLRCHRDSPLLGHQRAVWHFGFLVPVRPGIYALDVSSGGIASITGWAPPVRFVSGESGSFPWGCTRPLTSASTRRRRLHSSQRE